MEACIREELPAVTQLEENLRNGVILAKLGHFCAPQVAAVCSPGCIFTCYYAQLVT